MLAYINAPLAIAPDPRQRAWAGSRLGGPGSGVGELWLAHGGSTVSDGPHAGRTLDELAEAHPYDLVGTRATAAASGRFPLLAKLLDTAGWLSVQVHPDNAMAQRVEGPGACGKSEAWLVVDAAPGAVVLTGVRPGVSGDQIRASVGEEQLPELLSQERVAAGDAVDVPARTIHALGPGLLVYEIQQPSDTTYRLHDWGRTGRALHVDLGRQALDAGRHARVRRGGGRVDGTVITSASFAVDRLGVTPSGRELAADHGSCRVLTVLDGEIDLGDAPARRLETHATVVLPAAAPALTMRAVGKRATVLVARVP